MKNIASESAITYARSADTDQYAHHSFLVFAKDHPGRFALLALRKFASLWRPTPDAVHQ
jgi:hypothetical protein